MNPKISIHEYPTDPALLPEYRIAVMQAALEGKPLQYRTKPSLTLGTSSSLVWRDIASDAPIWNWEMYDYRIARGKFADEFASREGEKTAREWFETLPNGYRQRALAALELCPLTVNGRNDGARYTDAREALALGFWWHVSAEGLGFWTEVHDHLGCPHHCPLPPLPVQDLVRVPWTDPWKDPAAPHHSPLPPLPVQVPSLAPWTRDTVPGVGLLVRPLNAPHCVHLVTSWFLTELGVRAGAISFESLAAKWEHSVDNGTSWSPCGTVTVQEEVA